MGARKVGELTANGANVRQGYWGAEQESEGIFREKREEEKGQLRWDCRPVERLVRLFTHVECISCLLGSWHIKAFSL